MFQNRGDGTFDEVGNVLGLYLRLDSRGAASADLDGDGDLDLAVYNRNNPVITIYRNDTPGQGNRLLVDLRGTASDPQAAGAQAVASCGDRRILRQVVLGSGFLSQSASTLHFGLGGCRRVDALEVRWPAGGVETWEGLEANRRYVLTEGSIEVTSVALEPLNYNRDQLTAAAGELSAARPDLVFERLDGGGELALRELDGTTAVINFWATWCTACVSEMPDLEALHRRFGGRVRFLGISLDEGVPAEEVLSFLAARGVTYEQLTGDVERQQPFASLGASPPGAIPVTAVLHRGTVRDVTVGRIEAEELAGLLERLVEE